MTGSELTVTADRTTNRDHGKTPKPYSICTKTHQLDRVRRGAYAAIRPDFDFSTQAGFTQRAMRFHDSDFSRQTNITKRMGTGRAGSTVISGQVDNIRIGFGDADSNDANARYDRN